MKVTITYDDTQLSKQDAEYWLQNRAAILGAIEAAGFKLMSNQNWFWLSAAPTPPAQPKQPPGVYNCTFSNEPVQPVVAGESAQTPAEQPPIPANLWRAILDAGLTLHKEGDEWWIGKAAQPEIHPDDAAVDRFAAAMKEKMASAREKGRDGWQTCHVEGLQESLVRHVVKGDPRDVANFCMMLWNRSERTKIEHQWVYDLFGAWPAIVEQPAQPTHELDPEKIELLQNAKRLIESVIGKPAQPAERKLSDVLQPDAYLPDGSLNPKYMQPAERKTLEWRPIETAPVGEPILVLWKFDIGQSIAHKNEGGTWVGHEGSDFGNGARFTHWMPLPPPPENGIKGES